MIVLDTHILIWWINREQQLPKQVLSYIENHRGQIALSAISLWEIAMLVKKDRLQFSIDVRAWINKVVQLPYLQLVAPDHTILVQSVFLPEPFHADPADRIIVATALILKATLVTKDEKIRKYPHIDSYWHE